MNGLALESVVGLIEMSLHAIERTLSEVEHFIPSY
jgi:hypothetical protein